jgi:hypothetical protein
VDDIIEEEEEGPAQKGKNKVQNRIEAIKCFCMQVVANVPILFKNSFTDEHVQQCFNLLVPAAFGYI